MSLGDEGYEKLVAEVATTIGARTMMRLDGFDAYQPMAGIYEAERRQHILAKELIALTLSAARDGKVEIPREETRIKGCYIPVLGGYRDIIVLSEEEK